WAEVLLIFIVFFALAGEPVPHVNEPHYLGRTKHFWDPTWCAGDVFLESPDAHGLFVWSFGSVTKWLTLTETAWLGRVVGWGLLAWAWQRLSWRVIAVPLASALTAALWVTLTELAHLAGEWALGGVEAKVFAYVFVLVALRELIDGCWNRVWIALGLASAFHVLVGGWSIVVCAGIWLFEPKPTGFVRSIGKMLPGAVIGAALSLIGLVPALALSWGQPAEIVAEANQIYVFERLPHHLALLTLPTDEFLVRILRHVALIVCLWLFGRLLQRHQGQAGGDQRGLSIVRRFAWGAVVLSAIGFAIEISFWNSSARAASLLRFYWFRMGDVAVPLAVSLQAVALVVRAFREQKAWAIWALAGAIGLAGFHIGAHTAYRFLDPAPPADAPMKNYAAWVDACDWIKNNTPADAVFLTPRLSSTFKWRTDRPEVATRKDIPQDARSMVEWFHRLKDIYYYQVPDGVEPFNSVGELGTERAVEVARRYGAKYIVSDQDHPLALRTIYPTREYPNDEYVVYAVED
ncbi:MAG: DUF6798 domain-containing protein, partial [Pirellulales bacterium]